MGNCCIPAKPESTSAFLDMPKSASEMRPNTQNFRLSPADFIKLVYRPLNNEYTLLNLIGSGSFGEVWLGVHKESKQKRAIKQIFLSESNEEELEKLLKEVSILKCLDHPNIIRIYEVYKNKSKLSIVTEYLEGGELFDRIQKMQRFSENQAARYMLNMVSAVMHCHDCDIVHRDLKPENMLLEDDSEGAQLKLIDFGTSRFVPNDKKLKKPIGTCFYMAPEVLTAEYDKKVDVWSLGVILYVMLSGFVPFPGKTDQEIFSRIRNAPLSFDKPCWSSVSEEAKMLIRKMLEKKPTSRLSIKEVFNDPWLQERGNNRVPDKLIESESLRSLSEFRTEGKLQKAVYVFIISQFVEMKHFDKLKEVFLSLDKNGDGFLNKEEILQASESYNFHVNFADVLANCDHDKNGLINYSEFLTATVDREAAYNRSNLISAFNRFDKNGDGKIDLAELRSVVGGNKSDTVFKQMIQEADRNKDGVIDVEEFIEHMGSYVKTICQQD
jgi:calcium-dependent protein kinase